jgi:hypothetical protein
MARSPGNLPFSSNFEVRFAEPLDARSRVQFKSDLTKTSTWMRDGNPAYVYIGMLVSVYADAESNNGVYQLKASDFTIMSNWVFIGGAGTNSMGTLQDTNFAYVEDGDMLVNVGDQWINVKPGSSDGSIHIALDGDSQTLSFSAVNSEKMTWVVTASSQQVTPYTGYVVDTRYTPVMLSMPPAVDTPLHALFSVVDGYRTFGAVPVLLNPAGGLVDGSSSQVYLTGTGMAVTYSYFGEEFGWLRISDVRPGDAEASVSGSATAAITLSGHRAITRDATGQVIYASSGDEEHADTVIGVTSAAAAPGSTVRYVSHGEVITEGSWTWTPGKQIYLRTMGQLSQTPPTSGVLCVVGVALTATSMLVSPKSSIILA